MKSGRLCSNSRRKDCDSRTDFRFSRLHDDLESRLGPHLGRDPACLRDPTLPEVRLRPSPVDQVHRQPRRPNGG